jgi:hypothetical protein
MTGKLKRRELLMGIGALGAGGLTMSAGAFSMLSAPWLPGEESEHWRHLVRMQKSTQPGDIPWWYTGRIYGQVGEQAPEHLFNYEGTEIYWVEAMPNGAFAVSSRTLSFFRDKETGEMLREYLNPFTGKTNKVTPNQLGGKRSQIFSADGWQYQPESKDLSEALPWQIEWQRSSDLIWLTTSRAVKGAYQPLMECMTVFCPADAFMDSSVHNLPTHFTSTYLAAWQRWMEMGDRPGHLVWHSSGKKLASVDEIPDEYRQRAENEYGGLLTARPDSWD